MNDAPDIEPSSPNLFSLWEKRSTAYYSGDMQLASKRFTKNNL
jgi:hypothetical protein